MVQGVEKFKEYFRDYTGQYTFIGGAACDIILGDLGEDFRATKDLDMVLLIEAVNDEFVNTFIEFVEAGGYEHIDKETGENQFFRFSKPKNLQFPHMIELFSKRPEYLGNLMTQLGPIHISEDVMSLSAILLDEEYYEFLKTGVKVINDVSVLDLTHIILFKMKAWLDLSERKNAREQIDSKDIRKYKNDVFRLVASVDVGTRLAISGQIEKDTRRFLDSVRHEPVDVNNLGIRNATYEELVEVIMNCYGLKI